VEKYVKKNPASETRSAWTGTRIEWFLAGEVSQPWKWFYKNSPTNSWFSCWQTNHQMHAK